ncbi:unnamed protein product [Paramecium octaurelia]|uniref:C2H2-type domain-containing protein n=1 Tax=Paramecium octaurelia TaxID=43137 RepID=A0A8S1S327_PAROT|nr:unnamed protein product [Paramecium octaurelia]
MNLLNHTIQLLQQALQNLQQMQGKQEVKDILPQLTQAVDSIPEEFKELVPYQVEVSDRHLNHRQSKECIIKTVEQFRQWRAMECLKAETFEEVMAAHNQYYYRTLRQQVYRFIVITDGFRYSRGEAREKLAHCPFCKFQNLLTYVTAHVLKKHANNYQIYNCSICNKDFQSHRLLVMHIHNYHKEGVTPKKRNGMAPRKELSEQEQEDEDIIFEEADSPEISL